MPHIDPRIDTAVEAQTLRGLLAHVEQCWRRLGEYEPHWSVLTDPLYKADMISETIEHFYASGSGDVREFVQAVSRSELRFPSGGTCLELGCGVGRATPWLAQHFRHVIATDVSLSHLNVARQAMVESSCNNVELRLVNTIEAIESLPRFNCFFSIIVLQHNPPPVIHWLLSEMLAKLKLGGVAFFQLPTFLPNYQFDAHAYMSQLPDHGQMEMHALPYDSVLRIIDDAGCDLLESQANDCLGIADAVSLNFLVRKSFRSKVRVGKAKFVSRLARLYGGGAGSRANSGY